MDGPYIACLTDEIQEFMAYIIFDYNDLYIYIMHMLTAVATKSGW